MVSKDKSGAIYWLQGRWIPFEHPAPAWVLSVQTLLLCNTKELRGGEWGVVELPVKHSTSMESICTWAQLSGIHSAGLNEISLCTLPLFLVLYSGLMFSQLNYSRYTEYRQLPSVFVHLQVFLTTFITFFLFSFFFFLYCVAKDIFKRLHNFGMQITGRQWCQDTWHIQI